METSESLANYRHLALTVIERAFRDVLNGVCSSAEREGARAFLVGSPMMQHWCRVAGLDPRRVSSRASHLLLDRGAGATRSHLGLGNDSGAPPRAR
jgi:hypothetical protein